MLGGYVTGLSAEMDLLCHLVILVTGLRSGYAAAMFVFFVI